MAGRLKKPKAESAPYPPGWEPFLAAIKGDMADDTPRLVFADWLQESGDADRAEFIRLQCEVARGNTAAEPRADSLLIANFREWLRGFPPSLADNPARCTFRRGFPAAITVKGYRFASEGEAICRLTPVEELTVDAATPEALKLPAIAGIPKLTLPHLSTAQVEALAVSLVSPGPVELSISWGKASQRSIRKLLTNPGLTRLRRLSLEVMPVGNAVAAALAAAAHIAGLQDLSLFHTGFTSDGARALADTPWAANLRLLNLGNNPLGDDGLRRLIDSSHLRNLVELNLSGCRLTRASAELLAGWPGLRSVRWMTLDHNILSGPEEALILASPYATSLGRFRIQFPRIE